MQTVKDFVYTRNFFFFDLHCKKKEGKRKKKWRRRRREKVRNINGDRISFKHIFFFSLGKQDLLKFNQNKAKFFANKYHMIN